MLLPIILILVAKGLSKQHDVPLSSISITENVIGVVDEEYLSFNFDWWPNSFPGWNRSGLLNVDLSNPRLIYLAQQLYPAHLRIGGTMEDQIVYTITNDHLPCQDFITCFNMTRWSQVNDFARECNLTIAFGLNEMYGPGKSGTWNPNNTQQFLEYTLLKNTPVGGFELGNELNLNKYDPSDCANDFHTLRSIVDSLWDSESSYPKPLLIGPDATDDPTWINTFLQGAGPVLDIFTYHNYIGFGGDPRLPEELVSPSFLNLSREAAIPMVEAWQKYAPNASLWIGETAAAYHSGQYNTTNAFVSGFWFLDQLATLAEMNHKVFCRQALVGGNYELLDKYTLLPNPDYWSALLWKKFVGRSAIQIEVNPRYDDLRMYAHCSKQSKTGGITLIVINLSNTTTYQVDVSGLSGNQTRNEYHLTSDSLRSRSIFLNGNVLELNEDGMIPPITPNVVDNSAPIQLSPYSYGFIDFAYAASSACETLDPSYT